MMELRGLLNSQCGLNHLKPYVFCIIYTVFIKSPTPITDLYCFLVNSFVACPSTPGIGTRFPHQIILGVHSKIHSLNAMTFVVLWKDYTLSNVFNWSAGTSWDHFVTCNRLTGEGLKGYELLSKSRIINATFAVYEWHCRMNRLRLVCVACVL